MYQSPFPGSISPCGVIAVQAGGRQLFMMNHISDKE
jgi:hypothetical protein